MTDDDHLDDLASAYLDGAASPAEAARVEGDPALLARVEQLRAVRVALGELPPLDAVRRDLAVRAAVAAFEAEAKAEDDAAAPGAHGSVTSLAEVAARRGPPARLVQLAGAAAVVLLLAALVPFLASLGGSSDDDEAGGFEETAGEIGGDAADADRPSAPEAAGGATTTAADGGASDLQRYASVAELMEAVREGEPGGFSSGLPPDVAADAGGTCARAAADRAPEAATVAPQGTALVGETVVDVYVTSGADGTGRVLVFRAADCVLLGELPG